MAEINKKVEIDQAGFIFKTSRSSGPGGQNVNKLNTKVTLFFDVTNSKNLNQWQKRCILKKLASRSDKDGILRVSSQKHRTQMANKTAAIEKLTELITKALTPKKPRRKTAVPYREKIKRVEEKKKQGLLKQHRSKKINLNQ